MSKYLLMSHFLLLGIAIALVGFGNNFYTITSKLAQNNFLHLLHTSLICHFILKTTLYISEEIIGPLSISELNIYYEKAFDGIGDFIMILGQFSNEIYVSSAIKLSILYAFKSFTWSYSIKARASSSVKMFIGGFFFTVASLILAIELTKPLLGYLIGLEFLIIPANICKTQILLYLDLVDVETHRTLYVHLASIICHLMKIIINTVFLIHMTKLHRFPFSSLKSIISSVVGFSKRIILLLKYYKLQRDLKSIKEETIEGECVICTDDINLGKRLRCSHAFHSHCLNKWCEREVSCPICRAELCFNNEEIAEDSNEILRGIPVSVDESFYSSSEDNRTIFDDYDDEIIIEESMDFDEWIAEEIYNLDEIDQM